MIVSYRADELLNRTLESIAQARLANVKKVVLILNGPNRDAGGEERFPGLPLVIIKLDDRRKSAALNVGVRYIGDGPVVFLDDDVRVADHLFDDYAECFATMRGRFFCGGVTRCDYVAEPKKWLVPFLPFSAVGLSGPHSDFEKGARSFLGFNWAAYAEDILAVGGYDELIGPGTNIECGDETKMQGALMQFGLSAVLRERAIVWHFVPPERCSFSWTLGRHRAAGAFEMFEALRLPSLNLWAVLRQLKFTALVPFRLRKATSGFGIVGPYVAFSFFLARCYGMLNTLVRHSPTAKR